MPKIWLFAALFLIDVAMTKKLIVTLTGPDQTTVRKLNLSQAKLKASEIYEIMTGVLDVLDLASVQFYDDSVSSYRSYYPDEIVDSIGPIFSVVSIAADELTNREQKHKLAIRGRLFPDLYEDPLSVGNGLELRLLKQEEDNIGWIGTGQVTWDACVVMAKFLEKSQIAQGKSVLELGAGTGVVGIAAGLLGAARGKICKS